MVVTTGYLETLRAAGLTVEARPGNVLWLTPKAAILAELAEAASRVDAQAAAERLDTLESLKRAGPLSVPCPTCGRCLQIVSDAGEWFRFQRPRDGEGYILLGDYLRWKQRGGKDYAGAIGGVQ